MPFVSPTRLMLQMIILLIFDTDRRPLPPLATADACLGRSEQMSERGERQSDGRRQARLFESLPGSYSLLADTHSVVRTPIGSCRPNYLRGFQRLFYT